MIDYRRWIQQESDRLGAVLAGVDPTTTVPTCPGWSVIDLLAHVVTVQQFWSAVIGDRLDDVGVANCERTRQTLPGTMAELEALRRDTTSALITALSSRDPSEPAWSWFAADRTVGFSLRMQTHEATVHRVDAELAAGLPVSPVPVEVAGDGIDHVLDVMWASTPPDAHRRDTGVVELVDTDEGRRRLVRTFRWSGEIDGERVDDRPGAERATGGRPDATVTRTAADLYLLLWSRADHDVGWGGSPDVLSELHARLDESLG